MRAEERSALLDEVLPPAHEACAELTGPAEIERRSGVDPAVFAGRTDMVGGYMARAELEKVLAAPPQWLAQACAAAVAAEAAAHAPGPRRRGACGAVGPRQSARLGRAVNSWGTVSACAPQGRSGAGGTETVSDATAGESPTAP